MKIGRCSPETARETRLFTPLLGGPVAWYNEGLPSSVGSSQGNE